MHLYVYIYQSQPKLTLLISMLEWDSVCCTGRVNAVQYSEWCCMWSPSRRFAPLLSTPLSPPGRHTGCQGKSRPASQHRHTVKPCHTGIVSRSGLVSQHRLHKGADQKSSLHKYFLTDCHHHLMILCKMCHFLLFTLCWCLYLYLCVITVAALLDWVLRPQGTIRGTSCRLWYSSGTNTNLASF